MNWGNKLVVVFVVFALGMFYFLYKAVNTKYDLVSKEYYKEELRYQDKIDGKANAAKVSEVVVNQDAASVFIQFPKELASKNIQGELWFYCPTDAAKDTKIAVKQDADGKQIIAKSALKKGKFQLKASWNIGTELYYSEKSIEVN